MPITAFIGVRISWLIVARNELFASLAASAWRARASCVLASLNSRAFWIAITAWSAKVRRGTAARGRLNGWPPVRQTAIAPSTTPSATSGTTIRRSSCWRIGAGDLHRARVGLGVVDELGACRFCTMLPMMPVPPSITCALIASAISPTATIAR